MSGNDKRLMQLLTIFDLIKQLTMRIHYKTFRYGNIRPPLQLTSSTYVQSIILHCMLTDNIFLVLIDFRSPLKHKRTSMIYERRPRIILWEDSRPYATLMQPR